METFKAMMARHQQDSHVALAGDWHGQLPWALQKTADVAASPASLVLHLGDFSIWDGPRGKKFLMSLDRKCELLGVDYLVTLGNHENHKRINDLWANPKRRSADGVPLPLSFGNHIWVLPRPFRFKVNGVSFLSLGGAASVDFDVRTRNSDWWMEEMITWEHVHEATAGGPADVLLSHESPNAPFCAPAVEEIIASNPMGFSVDGLSYSKVSRNRITAVLQNVKPQLHAHGHMHAYGHRNFWLPEADHRTTVLSLDKDYESHNVHFLDLAKLRNREPVV